MGSLADNHGVDIHEATTHIKKLHTRKQEVEEKAEGPHSAQGGQAGVAWGPRGCGQGVPLLGCLGGPAGGARGTPLGGVRTCTGHQGLTLYRYMIQRMQTVMETQIHTSS